MDINKLIDKLDISGWKIFWLRIWNKEALIDYLYSKANNAINYLIGENQAYLSTVRAALLNINGYLCKFKKYIPEAWLPSALAVNDALVKLYEATEDYKIDDNEARAAIAWAKQKYSEFAAD